MPKGFVVEWGLWDSAEFCRSYSRAYAIAQDWNGQANHPRLNLRHHPRQTCGALHAPGPFMTRWFAATALPSSAASVEPRSNPPTNSPSARPWRRSKSTRLHPGGKTHWPRSNRWPAPAGSSAAWRRPWASRRSAYTSPFACSSGRASGNWSSNHHAPSPPLRPRPV